MKIKEFIKLEEDIDVYDDVCEELAIAFCGPVELTTDGEQHFCEVLDYDIDVDIDNCTAVVNVDSDEWKAKLKKAKEFFSAAAGYCSEENYNRWFCK